MSPRIARSDQVDRSGMEDFVRRHHQALLITTRADGRPQASPVTSGLDPEGRIVISTYPERAKAANVRRDPRTSVVVMTDGLGADGWIQVDGTAEVLDLPEALEPLVEYFRSISGEHPDWDEYRQAMQEQGKCLIRVVPERWSPVATGGFPARLAADDEAGA